MAEEWIFKTLPIFMERVSPFPHTALGFQHIGVFYLALCRGAVSVTFRAKEGQAAVVGITRRTREYYEWVVPKQEIKGAKTFRFSIGGRGWFVLPHAWYGVAEIGIGIVPLPFLLAPQVQNLPPPKYY